MLKNSKYNHFITTTSLKTAIKKDDKMGKSLFVKCICCCSALEISRDDEDDCFNVALWSNGPFGHEITSWCEKIRWCWNMIKTGMPWNDHTILSNEDAAKLAKYINKRLNK